MTAGRFPPWFISARRGIITPEENIHAVDVIDLSDIACKGDLVFCKVYQQLHLVDGFTLPFIVPYVGLPGAATGKPPATSEQLQAPKNTTAMSTSRRYRIKPPVAAAKT
jgi:hypothetical protein